MSKVEISKVAEVCKKNSVEPELLRRIIEELNLTNEPETDEEEKLPAVKKQFVVVISDPENTLPQRDYVGWVLRIPEDDSPSTALDRVFRGAYEFNATKKGRLLPVKTVGEALESVPAKFFKEAELWASTKTPVLVVKTDNEIPKE
jgi:hypothetical protein